MCIRDRAKAAKADGGTSGRNAVLMSAEDWQVIQETLNLLPVPGMSESIKEGIA